MGGKLHDLIYRLHIFKCHSLNYVEFKAKLKLSFPANPILSDFIWIFLRDLLNK